MHFLDLPVEMLQYIAQFLPVNSIVNLGQTCKHLLDVTNIDSIWQKLCCRDYKVNMIDGWDLTHKEVYTKVLKKCGFLGWKRIALVPYGGLVYVSWGKGEIQVLRYYPADSPEGSLQCNQIYSLQWNSDQHEVEVFCQQCEDGVRPALLAQDGPLYPVIQCAAEDCPKAHSRLVSFLLFNIFYMCFVKDPL
ncbi:F-box only protein 31-like [Elysia marginata]|uniref:F-box only protein 31-like n=1 Tax=Elysia marginata TaxID=1093978 RepID=A0AAV4FBR6_9GAST|nr:F-box only protein 31-like [Elysia marginata]